MARDYRAHPIIAWNTTNKYEVTKMKIEKFQYNQDYPNKNISVISCPYCGKLIETEYTTGSSTGIISCPYCGQIL